MDAASISRFITDTLDGLDAVVASGNTSFIHDPEGGTPPERPLPAEAHQRAPVGHGKRTSRG